MPTFILAALRMRPSWDTVSKSRQTPSKQIGSDSYVKKGFVAKEIKEATIFLVQKRLIFCRKFCFTLHGRERSTSFSSAVFSDLTCITKSCDATSFCYFSGFFALRNLRNAALVFVVQYPEGLTD